MKRRLMKIMMLIKRSIIQNVVEIRILMKKERPVKRKKERLVEN
jgi:hypothetical protein